MNKVVNGSSIIPALRYRDAHAAIDWLCNAFGFEKHAVYEDDQGRVAHAQLVYGSGMVMLGDVRDEGFGRHMAQPDDIHGRETQCAYVVVADWRITKKPKRPAPKSSRNTARKITAVPDMDAAIRKATCGHSAASIPGTRLDKKTGRYRPARCRNICAMKR